MMKIEPVAHIYSSCVSNVMMTHRFYKWINKVIILREIWLFDIVLLRFEAYLKEPVTIISRFGKNNVLGTIYKDIHTFRGWAGGVNLASGSRQGRLLFDPFNINYTII